MARLGGALMVSLAMGGGWLAAAAEADGRQFRAGDRWAVIGDSITHGRRYHSFVYLFHATRYPAREFHTFNCGISGDSADGALRRFDWDIAVHRPTVAAILLGMNDVNRGLYAPGQAGEKVEAARQAAVASHLRNLEALVGRLRALDCRVVLLTPSIFDQTGTQSTANAPGVNDALGACGRGAREIAGRLGTEVIDVHGPMTEMNARLQAADPAATLVGPDRVHPGDVGQLVMAYLILKGQGVSGTVAEVAIDAAQVRVTAQENAHVSELRGGPGTVAFTCLEGALPFPVLPAAAGALAVVPFMDELNREVLRVTGLPPGRYALRIDGHTVLAASDAELAAGVNLAGQPRSPMLKQAQAVLATEEKRHAIPASRLRTFAAQRHWLTRANPKLDPEDFEAVKAVLLADLETKRSAPNFAYFKGQADTYLEWKPREAELQRDLEEQTAAVWRLNRPSPHRFEVGPLTDSDAAELASRVLDDFETAEVWQPTNWTDTKPETSIADGCLTVRTPRTAGRRDMLGYIRRVDAGLAGVRVLKVRLRADRGAPFGVEGEVDGKLTRLLNYRPSTGDWETVEMPVSGQRLTSLTLILTEPSAEAAWPAAQATYCLDRAWLE